VIGTHSWSDHNFIQIIIFDPDRSVLATSICGEASYTFDKTMAAPSTLTGLDQMAYPSRRIEWNIADAAAALSSFTLSGLDPFELRCKVSICGGIAFGIKYSSIRFD